MINLLIALRLIDDTEINDYRKIYMDYISKCGCRNKNDLLYAADKITRKILDEKL